MSCKPDSLYLKKLEHNYLISLEKYHSACTSLNNLKTIVSIIISLFGVILSLALPILLNKNQFVEFFSIDPSIYEDLTPWFFTIIILMILGYLIIFGRLLFDKSSDIFEEVTSNPRLSQKTLYTQYKSLCISLTEKAREISYKYNICAKILCSVLLSSLILGVLTLLCLNGLGTGESTLDLFLTQIHPDYETVYSVPLSTWAFVSVTLPLHVLGFAIVLYSFAGSLNIEKMRYTICNVSCICSFVLQVLLVILVFVTNIHPWTIVLFFLTACLLMFLPLITEWILTIYLIIIAIRLKKEMRMKRISLKSI